VAELTLLALEVPSQYILVNSASNSLRCSPAGLPRQLRVAPFRMFVADQKPQTCPLHTSWRSRLLHCTTEHCGTLAGLALRTSPMSFRMTVQRRKEPASAEDWLATSQAYDWPGRLAVSSGICKKYCFCSPYHSGNVDFKLCLPCCYGLVTALQRRLQPLRSNIDDAEAWSELHAFSKALPTDAQH